MSTPADPIKKPQKIPDPRAKLVNPDGSVNKVWFDYFRDWDNAQRKMVDMLNDHETRIAALEP